MFSQNRFSSTEMSLIHAPSPSTAKQSFILFFFKGTAWGSRIQWVISLKALSIWIFLQRNFSSICHRLLFLTKGFQMTIIQLSKCINCKNMPSNRQINLKLQTEIGYYYKKKNKVKTSSLQNNQAVTEMQSTNQHFRRKR